MFSRNVIDNEKYLPDSRARHWWSHRFSVSFYLIAVMAAGLWVRCTNLGVRTFWVDEAESAINAMTILKHGVPVDHYLNLPIYENIMIQSWPENDEYEFRDISYSDRGLMIYHGWFPIYSIAGAFALFGVKYDEPTEPLSVRHTIEEIRRRTFIPRLPSVLFSIIFLILLFLIARNLGGPAAAWAALMAGSFTSTSVSFGAQARYYSATLMLIAASAFWLLKMIRRGRWRDYVLGAVCLLLLFHTHVLACAIMGIITVFSFPRMWRHQRILAKLAMMGLILAAGSIPWVVMTNFLDMFRKFPKALNIMEWPADLWCYPKGKIDILILFSLFLLWAACMIIFRKKLPQHFWEPYMRHRLVYVFLLMWLLISYALFIVTIPAASFFMRRMLMLHLVPGILLGAVMFADLCRVFYQRKAAFLAVVMMMLFLGATGRLISPRGLGKGQEDTIILIKYLRSVSFDESAKLYASPNDHLVLQYYTGLPVQSIAPVRREYLDNYKGSVIFIDRAWVGNFPDWEVIRQEAQSDYEGMFMSDSTARWWAKRFHTRPLRKELSKKGYKIYPEIKELPEFLTTVETIIEEKRNHWIELESKASIEHCLMLKDYTVKNPTDWWQIFFYRFVNPISRKGIYANYADRIYHSDAVILPYAERVIYYSHPLEEIGTEISGKGSGD